MKAEKIEKKTFFRSNPDRTSDSNLETIVNSSVTAYQGGTLDRRAFLARSISLAAASELLKAAVIFYGSAPPLDILAKVHDRVLGLYGETDERITSRVPAVAQAMKEAEKPLEPEIYAGASPAFFNDRSERYQAEAAWTRTILFLRTHLKACGPAQSVRPRQVATSQEKSTTKGLCCSFLDSGGTTGCLT